MARVIVDFVLTRCALSLCRRCVALLCVRHSRPLQLSFVLLLSRRGRVQIVLDVFEERS